MRRACSLLHSPLACAPGRRPLQARPSTTPTHPHLLTVRCLPLQMAYGAQGVRGAIPGNATLLFDVELVDVK